MSHILPNVKLFEIMENWRMAPKLKMVMLNHPKHKPIRKKCFSTVLKFWEEYQPAQQMKMKVKDLITAVHDKCHSPSPFLPGLSGTGRCTTRGLHAILMTLILSVQMIIFCQGGQTRLWQRPMLYVKMQPSLWLGFATSHRS